MTGTAARLARTISPRQLTQTSDTNDLYGKAQWTPVPTRSVTSSDSYRRMHQNQLSAVANAPTTLSPTTRPTRTRATTGRSSMANTVSLPTKNEANLLSHDFEKLLLQLHHLVEETSAPTIPGLLELGFSGTRRFAVPAWNARKLHDDHTYASSGVLRAVETAGWTATTSTNYQK